MRVTDLQPDEYGAFFAGYIANIPEITLRSAFDESSAALLDFLTHVPEERSDYAYAPGKWTIKECLQHIIDTERIFSYRALRIGRGDLTPLPGFEQNDFARVMDVSSRNLLEMIDEFRLVRQSSIVLFSSFTKDDLLRKGTMSGASASTRAIGYVMCGHVFHHANIFRERYA